MVCEIVVDGDGTASAGDGASDFHASAHIFETRQGARGVGRGDTDVLSGGDSSQGIQLIVCASERPLHAPYRLSSLQYIKGMWLPARSEIAGRAAEATHLAPVAHVEHAIQALLVPIDDQSTAGGHCPNQVMELALDRCQVVKDVSVIELEVVEHRSPRAVMDKLAALVEKGGVVFVGFQDKCLPWTQPGRDPEIHRHTADEKTGLLAIGFEHPSEHRGGGGFAMGARNRHHVAPVQDVFGQPLRPAGVSGAGVQNGLHQRELRTTIGQPRPADHIAHDKHVRIEPHLLGGKTFDQIDPQGAQLVAHRRVHARIAAGDPMTGLAGQGGQTAHKGPTNAQDMDMHAAILGAAHAQSPSMDSLRNDTLAEIAAAAARLVVEDGMEYADAKRHAVRSLGLPARTPWPDNDMLESAVREHIAIFFADTQPKELRALRELALVWMERLAAFRPHLSGAVWRGTATRQNDIHVQLYCDDPKSAEWALLDHRVEYHTGTANPSHGEPVNALTLRLRSEALGQWVLLHLWVLDRDDVRGALKADAQGRAPRGDAQAVRALLLEGDVAVKGVDA